MVLKPSWQQNHVGNLSNEPNQTKPHHTTLIHRLPFGTLDSTGRARNGPAAEAPCAGSSGQVWEALGAAEVWSPRGLLTPGFPRGARQRGEAGPSRPRSRRPVLR